MQIPEHRIGELWISEGKDIGVYSTDEPSNTSYLTNGNKIRERSSAS